jgi:hypothetical protein
MPGKHAISDSNWIWSCRLCAPGTDYANGEVRAENEEAAVIAATRVHTERFRRVQRRKYDPKLHKIKVLKCD